MLTSGSTQHRRLHCTSCGAHIHRMNVGHYNPDYGRFVNFDTTDDGAWIQDPISGYMRRIGRPGTSHTDLQRYTVHTCSTTELACD